MSYAQKKKAIKQVDPLIVLNSVFDNNHNVIIILNVTSLRSKRIIQMVKTNEGLLLLLFRSSIANLLVRFSWQ